MAAEIVLSPVECNYVHSNVDLILTAYCTDGRGMVSLQCGVSMYFQNLPLIATETFFSVNAYVYRQALVIPAESSVSSPAFNPTLARLCVGTGCSNIISVRQSS